MIHDEFLSILAINQITKILTFCRYFYCILILVTNKLFYFFGMSSPYETAETYLDITLQFFNIEKPYLNENHLIIDFNFSSDCCYVRITPTSSKLRSSSRVSACHSSNDCSKVSLRNLMKSSERRLDY